MNSACSTENQDESMYGHFLTVQMESYQGLFPTEILPLGTA